MHQRSIITLLLWVALQGLAFGSQPAQRFPFSTNASHLTLWDGEKYVPFTVKGTNLGIAVPGTFPGELRATAADYSRWFTEIQAAGFNCIRLYTLHFPVFYQTLDSFNRANPNKPLLFFQGVWLEEEIPNYDHNLYSLTPFFRNEIRENVGAVHGNRFIAPRIGKAHGTFNTDVSRWNLGYIIGREIYPDEVLNANAAHPADTVYEGQYLSLRGADPAETWITAQMDFLLQFEMTEFGTQRPISCSSWPTLDPIAHPFEINRGEDTAKIDLSRVDISKAPAGIFISYHAYPYYPDFMSKDPAYQSAFDAYGQNSYLGYLRDLKSHYQNLPLVIAEYGVPSSWGIAHFAQSGMHHGGLNELDQGKLNLRLFENILASECAGGIHFAWMDEWFKRTWINDPTDYIADSRIIWHNITSAEQNFGVIGYRRPNSTPQNWTDFGTGNAVEKMDMVGDPTFLQLQLRLGSSFRNNDTLWLALDTYADALGERRLPTGDTLSHGAEFVLRITNARADLLVNEAYDTYGIWHNVPSPQQLFRSIPSTGASWKTVRWRNNTGEAEIQYIGHLGMREPLAPLMSDHAVQKDGQDLRIRLPWTLLNVVAPDAHKVLHRRPGTNDTITDGIRVSSLYRQQLQTTPTRYLWPGWTNVLDVQPYQKQSYSIMQERLPLYPGILAARADSYALAMNQSLEVAPPQGLLANDLRPEPGTVNVQVDALPLFGSLLWQADGSFTYRPQVDFSGTDRFTYRLQQGSNRSQAVTVTIQVEESGERKGFVQLFPNPASSEVTIQSAVPVAKLELLDGSGRVLESWDRPGLRFALPVAQLPAGLYWLRLQSADQTVVRKFVKTNR